jgi:hypothetical protein
VHTLIGEVRYRGTGATRQRDAAADGLPGVVDMLVRQTAGA